MADYDWHDQGRQDRLSFRMVSQTDVRQEVGEIEGVILKGSTVSAAYYTDTRCQATLLVDGDAGGWDRGRFVRIVHEVPEIGWSRPLGTFAVTSDGARRRHGRWVTELRLNSILHTLSTDLPGYPKTLAKGSKALSAMRAILEEAFKRYDLSAARDISLGAPLVLESSHSQLKRLYALCSMSGNRIDVDGEGTVRVEAYKLPSSLTPVCKIDLSAADGISHDGISRSSDTFRVPTRVIVSHKWSETPKVESEKTGKLVNGKAEEREIVAVANASGGGSWQSRGYVVADFHSVDEMEPKTQQQAQRLADSYLKGDATEHVEWQLTCQHLPVWEGDVVSLVLPMGERGNESYGGRRKCLVKSLDLDLETMQTRLTLKEVGGITTWEEDEQWQTSTT